jgi:hypothetical protein
MENPRDSPSGGDAPAVGSGDGAESGAKSGDATPGTSSQQQQQQQQLILNGLPATTAEELSQLARAAITQQQGAGMFTAAGGDDGLAGTAGQQTLGLQDPSSAAGLTAGLTAGTDGTLNALLLNSGINLHGLGFTNLNQAALDGLLTGLPAGQAAGSAAAAAAAARDGGDGDGSGAGCSTQPNNKQLSSRFRCVGPLCWAE